MNALWLILSVLAYMSLNEIPERLNLLGKSVLAAHLVVIAIGIAGFIYGVAT